MEHYVICVWKRSLCEEDHHLIINYLITLFPSVLQYHHIAHFAEEVAVLLKPVSKYIAVLNTSEVNENVEWMHINKDLNIKDIISKEVNDCKNEFSSKDDIDQISASLHSLADQLPAFGTYKLDILLGSDILKELSVSKEPVLAGIFIRLTRWHFAHFTIFEQSEYDSDKLNEWCEITNTHILKKHSKLDLGPPLWRGAVSANTTDKTSYEGFELKLDIENEQYILHSSKEDTVEDHSDHIILSPKLQIMNEVSISSIPPYLISPATFRLRLGRTNVLNEKSYQFVDYLLNNKEAALILRLEYAEINSKTKPQRKYCTSRWQKAISSNSLRDPQCFVSTFDKYMTFAVAKSKTSEHITAYLLQKTNLDANFYFNIVNQRVPSPLSQINVKKSVEINENVSTEVPLIDGDLFHKFISKYVNQKMYHLEDGSLSTNADKNSDFSSLMETIGNFPTSFSFETALSNLLLEEIDPSDWPERIKLLHKQMENEVDEHMPANSLLGQSLKLPQQSFSLSSDFITQYFLPSGESKSVTNVESVYRLNSGHLSTCDFNRVLNLNWPEITNCIYHDLYYNSSCQTEDKECLGSQMVKLYVQHETASTCNNQQITQNFSIIVSEKSSTPSKEFRSPSCRTTEAVNTKLFERKNTSRKQNFLKDLISKKILSSRTLFPDNTSTAINKSVTKQKCRRNLNDSLVPVRCSPRKKKPVDYKYPAVNRNINNSKSAKNQYSSSTSDLLKKKMRHAVATALENNGINITHAFFKPCGSKLFSICKTFLDDLTLKKGKTSEYLQKIADAHVKQVIEFYQD